MIPPDQGISTCDYCGLPVGGTKAEQDSTTPTYCCLGCRVAAHFAGSVETNGQSRQSLIRVGLAVFFSMNVMVFTLALWTTDIYSMAPERQTTLLWDLYRYICLIFTVPVVLLLGQPLIESAIADVLDRRITTSLLMAAGVLAAFVYSVISTIRGMGQVYFEIVCMVLVAVTIGRWLEATGKRQAADALRALEKLLPDEVRLVEADRERSVPLSSIQPGDLIRVLPGERIPVDGRIVKNLGAIDEQAVTGEVVPAVKETGESVFSGTLSIDGDLTIEASAAANGGALERLVKAVLDAAAQKSRYTRMSDRLTTWFVPFVAIITAATFAAHALRGHWEQGLLAALAVVLIACPCALAMAMPLALWTALARAGQHQILIRTMDVLPRLAETKTVFFDKTGTLTTGQPNLSEFVVSVSDTKDLVLSVATSLASGSRHPMSQMILDLADENVPPLTTHQARSFAGRGISAMVEGIGPSAILVNLGSLRFMEETKNEIPASLQSHITQAEAQGASLVCVGWEEQVHGLFIAQETLRLDARESIAELGAMGIRSIVLTGDHACRASALGKDLTIETHGGLLPEEKLAFIHRFSSPAEPVVMVGDGINDAPALAAADVGVALGCGTDLSRYTADICLLGNQLERLPFVINLAKQTVRVIRWNLFWSLFYNLIGVSLAAAGLLNPILAAAAMVISSLIVISNSLRLHRWQPDKERLLETNLGIASANCDAETRMEAYQS